MGFLILCAFVTKTLRKNYPVINILRENEKYKKWKCISTSTETVEEKNI
jgi:hypothetical protein